MIDSQKERILITDPKKIRLLKKDFTKKILASFSDKPKTASDIARTISFPKEKIYYHIKNLLNHDILFIANTEIIKGIEQKQFLPTAKEFKVETEKLKSDDSPKTSTEASDTKVGSEKKVDEKN